MPFYYVVMNEKINSKRVRLNLLSFEQAEEVYKIKKRHKYKKIGEIAVELGFLEPESEEKATHGP